MLRGDLDFVIVVLRSLLSMSGTELRTGERDLERDDQRARWNAALVAYARVFLSGVGQRLKGDIFHADDAERHSYYMTLRNRHVAHSVSSYEEAGVLVSLSRGEPTTVVGLLDYFTTEQLPGLGGVLGLMRLAETAREVVDHRLDIERDRLLVFARARAANLALRERLTSVPASHFGDAVPVRRDSER